MSMSNLIEQKYSTSALGCCGSASSSFGIHYPQGKAVRFAVGSSYFVYGSFLCRWVHPVIFLLQHVHESPADALDQLLHLAAAHIGDKASGQKTN